MNTLNKYHVNQFAGRRHCKDSDGDDDDDDGSGDKKQSGKLRQSVVPGFRLSDDKRRRQEVHELQSG